MHTLASRSSLRRLLTRHSADDINNCGLVFLETTNGKPMRKGESDTSLFLRAKTLHFMFFGENQGYHLRDGRMPHAAMSFATFFSYAKETDHPVYVYETTHSHSNSYISVVNGSSHAQSVPWCSLYSLLEDTTNTATDGCHSDGYARDFGKTGNQSCSRDGSSSGHSEPNTRRGTNSLFFANSSVSSPGVMVASTTFTSPLTQSQPFPPKTPVNLSFRMGIGKSWRVRIFCLVSHTATV
jgi:hypothetical protein